MARPSARELPKSIGRYEVARQLGVGAMGRVLLARDPVLERHVAIKVLRDDLNIAEEDRDALLVRMRHEARAAARVTHPNLCVIHDMGEDDDLGLYLVFEYIEGPTLKQRLLEGRLSARAAARIAKEIGSALTFAHERGVLHRDVKPENIILSPTGSKLTDFGIARIPDSTLTHTGGLMGTPAYSAPETFQKGAFSPESDQFSLAATLYEAIRGARAFPGDDAVSVASKIANDPPERFAASLRYAEELDDALARGMAKDKDARFESCRDLGNVVMELLLARSTIAPGDKRDPADTSGFVRLSGAERGPTAGTRPSDPPRAPAPPWRVLVGGLFLLAVVGLLARALLRNAEREASPPEREASARVDAELSATGSAGASSTRPPRSKPSAPRSAPTVHVTASATAEPAAPLPTAQPTSSAATPPPSP